MPHENIPGLNAHLEHFHEMIDGLEHFWEITSEQDGAGRLLIGFTRAVAMRDYAGDIALAMAHQGIDTGQLSNRAAADRLIMHPNTLKKRIAERIVSRAMQDDIIELGQHDT